MDTQLDERSYLGQQINYWYGRWRRGERAWSAAHYGAVFGASVLSAAVGYCPT